MLAIAMVILVNDADIFEEISEDFRFLTVVKRLTTDK